MPCAIFRELKCCLSCKSLIKLSIGTITYLVNVFHYITETLLHRDWLRALWPIYH